MENNKWEKNKLSDGLYDIYRNGITVIYDLTGEEAHEVVTACNNYPVALKLLYDAAYDLDESDPSRDRIMDFLGKINS